MKRYLFLIALLIAWLGRVVAQSVTVDATIDSLQILIGEQAKIKLQVSLDADKRAIFPVYTDTHGPSAVIKSLGKLDQVKSGGTLLNQRFLPSLLKREEDISKLSSLIRSYFALGGHHIQFNIVDTETLYAAQKCPEDYRDLLVRVAGYSDYFNDMNADLQADVIMRTEQETF